MRVKVGVSALFVSLALHVEFLVTAIAATAAREVYVVVQSGVAARLFGGGLYDLLVASGEPAATPRPIAVRTSPSPSCGEKTLPWAHSYTSTVYWEAELNPPCAHHRGFA